jgi:hypothetical protein
MNGDNVNSLDRKTSRLLRKKQGVMFSPQSELNKMIFSIRFRIRVMKIQETQDSLKLNRIRQLLAYAEDNLLAKTQIS